MAGAAGVGGEEVAKGRLGRQLGDSSGFHLANKADYYKVVGQGIAGITGSPIHLAYMADTCTVLW